MAVGAPCPHLHIIDKSYSARIIAEKKEVNHLRMGCIWLSGLGAKVGLIHMLRCFLSPQHFGEQECLLHTWRNGWRIFVISWGNSKLLLELLFAFDEIGVTRHLWFYYLISQSIAVSKSVICRVFTECSVFKLNAINMPIACVYVLCKGANMSFRKVVLNTVDKFVYICFCAFMCVFVCIYMDKCTLYCCKRHFSYMCRCNFE